MKLKLLRRRHAECDVETWQRYHHLAEGGPHFKKNIKKYLPQHEVEPAAVYKLRCELAHYLNYCGPIAQYFSSMLFSSPPVIASDPDTVDEEYADFKEDADGKGTDLDAFIQECFNEAMVKKCSFARVELPTQPSDEERDKLTLKDFEDQGLGAVRLCKLSPENVINWRKDERGRFLWVVEYDRREELLSFGDEECTVTETWTWWSDDDVKRWQLQYKKSERPDIEKDVPEVAPPQHLGRIPIVALELPSTLWLMSFIADAQLEHFRKSCGLSWSIDRSCYAMPYFFLVDAKKPPKQGAGYYGLLGEKDRVEWPAPSAVPYETIETRIAALKDEIHRVAQQMARGVENNAAAVGRSGASKIADNTATEVVLGAYAHHVCEFIESLMDLVSFARSDDVNWSVTNPATFDLGDANTLIQNAILAMPLGIMSAEHQIQTQTAIAMAMNAHADETAKKKIRQQIVESFSPEAIQMMQMAALRIPPPPGGAGGAQQKSTKPADSTKGTQEPPANDQPMLPAQPPYRP